MEKPIGNFYAEDYIAFKTKTYHLINSFFFLRR